MEITYEIAYENENRHRKCLKTKIIPRKSPMKSKSFGKNRLQNENRARKIVLKKKSPPEKSEGAKNCGEAGAT